MRSPAPVAPRAGHLATRGSIRTPALLIAVLVCGGTLAQSQSLGEAAAKEKERRAKIHASGKSFTDSDLQEAAAKREREASGSSREAASPSPPPAAASAKSPAVKDAARPSPAATTGDAGDEAESAKRARGLDLKTRLASVNVELSAAEARLKEAQRQWDAVYMHSVGYPLEQAAAHLESAKKDVARLSQQRDEIEETALRENIPPGYMR
jgi:hypothetical protein